MRIELTPSKLTYMISTLFPSDEIYKQLKSEKYSDPKLYTLSPDFLDDLDESEANKYIWMCMDWLSWEMDEEALLLARINIDEKHEGDLDKKLSVLSQHIFCIKKAYSICNQFHLNLSVATCMTYSQEESGTVFDRYKDLYALELPTH